MWKVWEDRRVGLSGFEVGGQPIASPPPPPPGGQLLASFLGLGTPFLTIFCQMSTKAKSSIEA